MVPVGSSTSPRRSAKSDAFSKYSHCIASAESSRPVVSLTGRLPVTSWLISRIARMGFSSDMSRITMPASSIRRTRSAEPTLSSVVVSLMLLSPTITWSRRYRSASACGSSRVLMIGRDRVVALETPSHMWSARWLRQYTAPRGVCSTFPAPAMSCREIRNGMKRSASLANSPLRSTR